MPELRKRCREWKIWGVLYWKMRHECKQGNGKGVVEGIIVLCSNLKCIYLN